MGKYVVPLFMSVLVSACTSEIVSWEDGPDATEPDRTPNEDVDGGADDEDRNDARRDDEERDDEREAANDDRARGKDQGRYAAKGEAKDKDRKHGRDR